MLFRLITALALLSPAAYAGHVIRLNCGVVLSEPYAVMAGGSYSGMHIDLIEAMKGYAMDDGYELNVTYDGADMTPGYNDALDLIANDCTGMNCEMFDMLLGDYFINKERMPRVSFTPSFISTEIVLVKTPSGTYSDLDSLNDAGGTYCVTPGTATSTFVSEAAPDATPVDCSTVMECLEKLKNMTCDVHIEDSILVNDPNVTKVKIEGQTSTFVAWPFSSRLSGRAHAKLAQYMNMAITDGTVGALIADYFPMTIDPPTFSDMITIPTGIFYSAPYSNMDGTRGLYTALLDKVVDAAAADNITMTFNTSQSATLPSTYNGALELISSACMGPSCETFDMIVANYFITPERTPLVTFTPSIGTTTVGTVMMEGGPYMNMAELQDNDGNYCITESTAEYDEITPMYPEGIVGCSDEDDCYMKLMDGDCDLFVSDILLARYRASMNSMLRITDDNLAPPQFIAWPLKSSLEPEIYVLMNKYLYMFDMDGTLAALDEEFFGDLMTEMPTEMPTMMPTMMPTDVECKCKRWSILCRLRNRCFMARFCIGILGCEKK
jgi:ABC-type amino acid transport substrate-binding protein